MDWLEFAVGSIAEYGAGTVLASAKIDGLCFGSFELHGREVATLVAAVAKGLVGTLATGTPVVAFAGFNFDRIGTLLGNLRFRH
jgi:hypothetical protein